MRARKLAISLPYDRAGAKVAGAFSRSPTQTHAIFGRATDFAQYRDIACALHGDAYRRGLCSVKRQGSSRFVVGVSEQATDPRAYRDYFSRLLRRLQIPPIVFHGLRHTFATRCIESQCDYKTVSTVLGHSDVSTTLNLYVHPNLVQKRRCIEKMSRFVDIG